MNGITLYPHQEKLKEINYNFCLFWDVGTGKSIGALTWAEKFFVNDRKVIVLAPASILNQWKQECEKYYPEKIVKVIKGKNREYNEADIFIVSYETLKNDYKKLNDDFLRSVILICDEATKFKNFKTNTHKMMREIAKKVAYKIVLTGTPLEVGVFELWSICSIVFPMWMNYNDFKNNHVEYDFVWNGRKEILVPVGLKNLEVLREKLKKISSRIKKEDIRNDLPPLLITWREVELSEEQKKVKKQLAEYDFFQVYTLLKMLDNGVNELTESESDTAKTLIYNEEKPKKVEALEEIMEELNSQVIIFTRFVRSAEQIYTHLSKKYNCEVITGQDTQKDKKIEDFKLNKYQVLITTDTLARGVSFDAVDTIIQYDLPFNPAVFTQRVGRIHRINSQKGKLSINLIGNIVDNYVYEILKERDKTFMFLIDGIGENEFDMKLINEIAKRYGSVM